MKSINTPAIRYENKQLFVLNQQKLPQQEEWIEIFGPEQMIEVIVSLKVRGAPMIGLAALLAIAQLVQKGSSRDEIKNSAYRLRKSRPTAVNLSVYLDRIVPILEKQNYSEHLLDVIETIFEEDVMLCQDIAKVGTALIQSHETLLTYCNTGSLATAGVGTALGVIKQAHRDGKNIHVMVPETRPLLQGGRLTSWELGKYKIPYTLICDNMVGQLMSLGKIQRVIVGADRIAANGDFANKIGTYTMAVLAHYHNIPFHVAAPYTTCDAKCENGKQILIEERVSNEVRGAFGAFGQVTWSPKDAPVYNPSFDVTPGHLVTSYILNIGNLNLTEFIPFAKNKDTN